jgi:hypothetical protein
MVKKWRGIQNNGRYIGGKELKVETNHAKNHIGGSIYFLKKYVSICLRK